MSHCNGQRYTGVGYNLLAINSQLDQWYTRSDLEAFFKSCDELYNIVYNAQAGCLPTNEQALLVQNLIVRPLFPAHFIVSYEGLVMLACL